MQKLIEGAEAQKSAGKSPDEVYEIYYNADESPIASELKTALKSYLYEARAKFATGLMDPNNDADWNAYIAELENIEITEDDVTAEYARLAEQYKMEADQIKGMIPADSITADLKAKKAMELVKANAVAPKAE